MVHSPWCPCLESQKPEPWGAVPSPPMSSAPSTSLCPCIYREGQPSNCSLSTLATCSCSLETTTPAQVLGRWRLPRWADGMWRRGRGRPFGMTKAQGWPSKRRHKSHVQDRGQRYQCSYPCPDKKEGFLEEVTRTRFLRVWQAKTWREGGGAGTGRGWEGGGRSTWGGRPCAALVLEQSRAGTARVGLPRRRVSQNVVWILGPEVTVTALWLGLCRSGLLWLP